MLCVFGVQERCQISMQRCSMGGARISLQKVLGCIDLGTFTCITSEQCLHGPSRIWIARMLKVCLLALQIIRSPVVCFLMVSETIETIGHCY